MLALPAVYGLPSVAETIEALQLPLQNPFSQACLRALKAGYNVQLFPPRHAFDTHVELKCPSTAHFKLDFDDDGHGSKFLTLRRSGTAATRHVDNCTSRRSEIVMSPSLTWTAGERMLFRTTVYSASCCDDGMEHFHTTLLLANSDGPDPRRNLKGFVVLLEGFGPFLGYFSGVAKKTPLKAHQILLLEGF
jgi:hypothetical protein